MSFGDRIKTLRLQRELTLEEVGKSVGVGKSTVRKWESGEIANMRRDKIALLAKALGVTPGFLMGWEEQDPPGPSLPSNIRTVEKAKVPLIGSIAAGIPIFAEEDYENYIEADSDLRCDFALIVEGDSMEPTIHNGDVVFIRKQDDVDDGQIAAVIIDDSATLKHVYHIPGGIQLISENTKYPPQYYTIENSDYVAVLGRVVAYRRML